MRIELYYSYISEADHRRLAGLLPALPPPRREQVAARCTQAAQAESIAVSALLQQAVDGWKKGVGFGGEGVGFCAVPVAALTAPFPHWEADQNGRPFPHGLPTAAGQVWVSLSHSGGHLLVAVADRPVGADIQWRGAAALAPDRFRRLDDRIRHPAESPAADEREAAARWAAKEAAVKLTGQGLACPLRSLCVQNGTVLYPDGEQAAAFAAEQNGCAVAVAVTR